MELQKRVYVVGTISDTGNGIALIGQKQETKETKELAIKWQSIKCQNLSCKLRRRRITGEDIPPEKYSAEMRLDRQRV